MKRLLFIIFCIWPALVWAVPDYPLETRRLQLSFERRGFNAAIASAHDHEGYTWLASIRGLHVYDGHDVKQVLDDALNGTKVNNLHVDSLGNVWIASNSGLLSYSATRERSVKHRTSGPESFLHSRPAHVVFEDRRGTIWAGVRYGGLFRYEPSFDTFQPVPLFSSETHEDLTVYDIAEDANRDIWIASDQGVFRLNGSHPPATPIPLPGGQPYTARKIAFDGHGTLWVAAMHKGLWKMPADHADLRLTRVSDLNNARIADLHTDTLGDVWIAANTGLFRQDFQENKLIRHPLLPTDYADKQPIACSSINEDKAGNLWIGTYAHGVFQATPRPAAKLVKLVDNDNEHSLLGNIIVFNPADQRLYVSPVTGGLYRSEPMSGNDFMFSETVRLQQMFNKPKIKSMVLTPDHALLLGSIDQVQRVTTKGDVQSLTSQRQHPDPNRNMRSLFDPIMVFHADTDGRTWFADRQSIFVSDQLLSSARKVATANTANACGATVFGSTLFVNHGPVLHVIDTRSISSAAVTLPAQILQDGDIIKGLYAASSQELWIGASRGIFRTNLQTGQFSEQVDPRGNPITFALSFHRHNDGDMWIHTQDKIFRIPSGSRQASHMLRAAEDTAANITSKPAAFPDGKIGYGHSNGLFMVDPRQVLRRKPTPTLIAEVRIFDALLPHDTRGRTPSQIHLAHDENYLAITLANPSIESHIKPHFFYKLDGVDTDWIDAGPRYSASYAHLTPGKYVFLVKEGLGETVPASLTITIAPPWWKTTWALSLYLTIGALTVYGLLVLFSRAQTARIRREMLEELVMQDPLTGIPNRRKFQEVLAAEKSRCKRSKHDIAIIMIDIDLFKGFNDRFGHQAGDEALKKVAQSLKAALRRPEDFVARYGGEEFVAVLPNTDQAGAEKVARKMQDAIFEAAIPYPGSPMADRVTVSLGISTFKPYSDLHIEAGLFSADQALYQAKRCGRNCFFFKKHSLSEPALDTGQEASQTA